MPRVFNVLFSICLLITLPNVGFCQEAADKAREVLTENTASNQEKIPEGKPIHDPAIAAVESNDTIFDDLKLLAGYSEKYKDLPKEILLVMINDNTLTSYKSAAAVREFRINFADEIVSREKRGVEKALLRRFDRADSPFVQIEIMYTLNSIDRYRYFKSMTPALIQKLNHYNDAVNELAFQYLEEIIASSNNRAREAVIVFNTLRKMLFLSRNRLVNIDTPDQRLSRKLKILRWSIKVLGNSYLKKLPKEVISLL